MDEIDRANELAQRERETELARVRAAAARPRVAATGACLWCGEPCAKGARWCNAECRDDYQRSLD